MAHTADVAIDIGFRVRREDEQVTCHRASLHGTMRHEQARLASVCEANLAPSSMIWSATVAASGSKAIARARNIDV